MKYGELVSIIIATYNHEQFIAECLQSACNQTYPNVEVIVCDDCSTDSTPSIIKQFAEHYKGRANLRYYLNEKNLGAIENYQKCLSLCAGEIIVEQDGDDVAFPERVEETVRVFQKDRRVKAIFSNAVYTDEKGVNQGLYYSVPPVFVSSIKEFEACKFNVNHIFTPYVWMLGATGAFVKEVYTLFDRIDPRALHEDGVFSFRALLLGTLVYVDKPLVRYRRHSNAVSAPYNFKGRIRLLKREYYYFRTQHNDAIKMHASKETLSKVKFYKAISYVKSKVFGIPLIGEALLYTLLFFSHVMKKMKRKN